MSDLPAGLEDVLRGRERRAELQSRLMSRRAGGFVCQIALNVPGLPKRTEGDELLINLCKRELLKHICSVPLEEVQLNNGAGLALLLLCDGGQAAAQAAKRAGVLIEEGEEYGRAVDIDVITAQGALSRGALGLEARRCLLCGEDSRECTRERRHPYEELRAKTEMLISVAAPTARHRRGKCQH